MEKTRLFQTNLWKGLLAVIFALAFFALTPGLAAAQSGETGDVCISHYASGNCTANDFGVKELYFDHVITACGLDPQHPGYANVVLEAVLSTARPTRYDVGIFLALDGGSANDGTSCFHDYLNPPLTATPTYIAYYPAGDPTLDDIFNGPWWETEGDTCGDMQPDTTVIKTLEAIWIKCVDTNSDGHVDISACGSYEQTAGVDCFDVTGAIPGTTAKCGCTRFELPFTPTGIENLTFSVSSQAVPTGLILSAIGLVLIGGVLLSVYLRRRMQA
jgi:hypothetical protein